MFLPPLPFPSSRIPTAGPLALPELGHEKNEVWRAFHFSRTVTSLPASQAIVELFRARHKDSGPLIAFEVAEIMVRV